MPEFDDRLEKSKVSELHHKEEEMLIRALAPKHGYKYVDLYDVSIDAEALWLIPESVSREAEIAVFARGNRNVSVALRNPKNPKTNEVIETLRQMELEPVLYMASLNSIAHAWERYHDLRKTTARRKGVLDINPDAIAELAKTIQSHLDVASHILTIRNENGAERVSKTIEVLFGGALALKASDIHIEPEPEKIRVRFRLDGVLWDITDMETHVYRLVISRLKLLSGLKLNVHNEAQDGRFTFDIGDRELEVRSSVIPGAHGESMVMRLLDPNASSFKLEHLGLNARLHEVMLEELERPNGAIVTTGPTGSGKTTALYAFMQTVHNPEIKIITIEDPVEYKLPGIVQTQVDDEYTFATGLRAILRQDPDVIMVGEIRDRDVAETAVHAALTGHLVFSTLHTNSAVGAFPRLMDLGVDSRMIGSAFNVILGQRLVRVLCKECREERDATTEEQKVIARIMDQPVAMHKIFHAPGCDACGGSGFKGRIGIYEAIRVDKAVEEAVISDPRESNILEAARSQNIPSMQQDGIMKVLAGITSFDELARVVDLYYRNTPDEKQLESGESAETAVSEHVV
jgi:type II secretory ATPase GspE/PulE/Tfp pilus assembly ATPase PilB-like protein